MKNAKLFMIMCGLVLTACNKGPAVTLPGYIEAEYTHMAAPIAGRLVALPVSKGAEVKVGAPLFILDTDSEKAAVDEARARIARSNALAADLAKGKRQDEIAVLEAQYAAAQANLAQTQNDLKRQRELERAGFTSGANLEALQTKSKAEAARVDEMTAQLKVARLAARQDARAAAGADISTAQAQLAQSQWRLDQKLVVAPVTAHVADTLYQIGEWVPAGMPVVSLLAPAAIKVRFFIPQEKRSQFPVGSRLRISCDGCKSFVATVNYVAQSAEFTPPVIYSKENRAKLVFLAEAKPESGLQLPIGQPVDVELMP